MVAASSLLDAKAKACWYQKTFITLSILTSGPMAIWNPWLEGSLQFVVYLPVIGKSELESYCQIGRQGPGNEMLDLILLSNSKTISVQ